MEFLQRINNASWRHAFAKEKQRVDAMASATLARVQHHTIEPGDYAPRRFDARANNGIHAVCALPPWGNRELCAAKQCGNCRENLRAASARAALLGHER
eukprot:CAMPEP_0206034142 /NCGR_PEP_ID=MMETSP1466-20131121/1146_1 /ASSEMBLY_ACC=CAM_ASM_001126 /TAXON_ID=44452 /ORGANISM="Pavlova gyrans, Strain CCMP608" /LENGTH=98 /DNA_ID=CAMNT_0053408403 /DNA_START=131 /DNA_END=428 /DNA_ORIENTATION=-